MTKAKTFSAATNFFVPSVAEAAARIDQLASPTIHKLIDISSPANRKKEKKGERENVNMEREWSVMAA